MFPGGPQQARGRFKRARLSSADDVVDIGCGPGSAVRAAARNGAHVTGVDPSPLMLRLARTVTRNQPRVAWSQGTAENLPLPSSSATVAWSVKTVHHWRDVTAGLAEVTRVLVAGGRVFALERQVRADLNGLANHGGADEKGRAFAWQGRAAGLDTVRVGIH